MTFLRDQKALTWLEDEANAADWQRLEARCPWSSPYQSYEFTRIWLRHYSKNWEPALVISIKDGVLRGILPLAIRDGMITGMGAHQAEYHGCLCDEQDVALFLAGSIAEIFENGPGLHLRLRYIDKGRETPRVRESLSKLDNVIITRHIRPLIKLDSGYINRVLHKKHNRSRMNGLNKRGRLELICDVPSEKAGQFLDALAAMYDLRQGAINDVCPFNEDSSKYEFHLDLLKYMKDQVRMFLLTLDNELIGGLIAVGGKEKLSDAIIAHSPRYARYSPGRLIIYLAAALMVRNGIRFFDLTPGGDKWKEHFANEHDEVLEIEAWGSSGKVRLLRIKDFAFKKIRKALYYSGLSPYRVRRLLKGISRNLNPTAVCRRIYIAIPRQIEFRVYRMTSSRYLKFMGPFAVLGIEPRKDNIQELLLFKQSEPWRTRKDFLEVSLRRLENGEHVYTIADRGILLHYGWLIDSQAKSFFSEVQSEYEYPEEGAVLYDFYTHPKTRGKGLYQHTLTYILNDLMSPCLDSPGAYSGGVRHFPPVVYISVRSDNVASRRVIEKLGFEYIESIVRYSIAGRYMGSAKKVKR